MLHSYHKVFAAHKQNDIYYQSDMRQSLQAQSIKSTIVYATIGNIVQPLDLIASEARQSYWHYISIYEQLLRIYKCVLFLTYWVSL